MSNWQAVGDVANSLVTRKTPGCRDCGTIMTYTTPTGQYIERPGTECCAPAVRRQIAWRSAEIDRVQAVVAERRKDLERLELQIEEAEYPTQRKALEARAAATRRRFDAAMHAVHEPQLRELSSEIARLKRLLHTMEGTTT